MNQNKQNPGQQGADKGKQRESGERMEDPRKNQPNRSPDAERDVADDSGEQGISNRPEEDPDSPETGASRGKDPDQSRPVKQRPGQRRDN